MSGLYFSLGDRNSLFSGPDPAVIYDEMWSLECSNLIPVSVIFALSPVVGLKSPCKNCGSQNISRFK